MAMRMMKQTMAAIFGCLLATPPTANAGPFGYDMGDSLPKPPSGDPLPIVELVGEEAPTGFDALLIVGTPRTGICKLVAIKAVKSNRYGDEYRREADRLVRLLTGKYGTPSDSFDFLRRGSIWEGREHWRSSIREGDRHYSFFWEFTKQREDKLTTIVVSTTYGGVELGYEFENFRTCKAESEKAHAEQL